MKSSIFLPALALTAGAAFALGWIAHPAKTGDGDLSNQAALRGNKAGSSARSGIRPSAPRSGKGESGPVEDFLASYRQNDAISPEDMTAAMKAMRKENDPLLRRKLFTALLEQLTPDNAKAAYVALQSGRRGGGFGRGGGGDDELRLLANAWGRLDGPGAVKALTEMREEARAAREENGGGGGGRFGGRGRGGDMRSGMDLVSVLSGWATTDGTAAANYVNGIESEREKTMAAFGVVRGMMVNGVDQAMNYVSSLPQDEAGGRARGFYMSTIASEMLEEGVDAAKSWVDTISDPQLKGGALSRVAESAIREDLPGAVEWVTKYAGDESASRAISRVANEWAEDDPQAVLEWADTLPDHAKAEAYGEAFDEWADQDATAAGEYLQNMQASPARDAAIEEYATNVARQDPQGAIQWAQSIGDEETRTETLTEVASDWYRRDQTAATQWLETSGLPEESVKTITEAPQRGGFDFRQRGGRGGGRGR